MRVGFSLSRIILSAVWWSVNCQPAAADVGSLDLHSETINRSVFKHVLPRLCQSSLTSVEHCSDCLHHGGTRQSPWQKERRREWFIQEGRETKAPSQASPSYIIILQLAAFTLVGLSSCLLLLNAPMSLCSQVYPSTCLFQRRDRKEGMCEMREKWFICLHLLPAECQQVLVIELLFFLDFSRAKSISLMRIGDYFNIALVTELE